jgi:hypothetical protein
MAGRAPALPARRHHRLVTAGVAPLTARADRPGTGTPYRVMAVPGTDESVRDLVEHRLSHLLGIVGGGQMSAQRDAAVGEVAGARTHLRPVEGEAPRPQTLLVHQRPRQLRGSTQFHDPDPRKAHRQALGDIVVPVNLEKVVFGFFVLLAATLNFGYVLGDLSNPDLHNVYELYAAVAVNIIATILKFGDRTQIGAVHLATSLVASIQLIIATLVWIWGSQVDPGGLTPQHMASVVSIAAGALLANIVSLILLVVETVSYRRR